MSVVAMEIPIQMGTKLPMSARPIQTAAKNQIFSCMIITFGYFAPSCR